MIDKSSWGYQINYTPCLPLKVICTRAHLEKMQLWPTQLLKNLINIYNRPHRSANQKLITSRTPISKAASSLKNKKSSIIKMQKSQNPMRKNQRPYRSPLKRTPATASRMTPTKLMTICLQFWKKNRKKIYPIMIH